MSPIAFRYLLDTPGAPDTAGQMLHAVRPVDDFGVAAVFTGRRSDALARPIVRWLERRFGPGRVARGPTEKAVWTVAYPEIRFAEKAQAHAFIQSWGRLAPRRFIVLRLDRTSDSAETALRGGFFVYQGESVLAYDPVTALPRDEGFLYLEVETGYVYRWDANPDQRPDGWRIPIVLDGLRLIPNSAAILATLWGRETEYRILPVPHSVTERVDIEEVIDHPMTRGQREVYHSLAETAEASGTLVLTREMLAGALIFGLAIRMLGRDISLDDALPQISPITDYDEEA